MKYPCVSDNYIGTERHYLLLACKYLITAHCSRFVHSFMMSYTFVVPSHTVEVNNEAFLTNSIIYTIMLDTSMVHNILFPLDLCYCWFGKKIWGVLQKMAVKQVISILTFRNYDMLCKGIFQRISISFILKNLKCFFFYF